MVMVSMMMVMVVILTMMVVMVVMIDSGVVGTWLVALKNFASVGQKRHEERTWLELQFVKSQS